MNFMDFYDDGWCDFWFFNCLRDFLGVFLFLRDFFNFTLFFLCDLDLRQRFYFLG
jgi:hypothetical protein